MRRRPCVAHVDADDGAVFEHDTLEERDGRFSPRNSHPYDRRHDRHPP
jgi:hypothetical protein